MIDEEETYPMEQILTIAVKRVESGCLPRDVDAFIDATT